MIREMREKKKEKKEKMVKNGKRRRRDEAGEYRIHVSGFGLGVKGRGK
jgi:hypothetical protein